MGDDGFFLYKDFFHWFWAGPLLWFAWVYGRKKEMKLLGRFSENWDSLVAHRYSRPLALVRSLCFVATFILIVFALARPRLGFNWQERPKGGTDILLVVDVSKSMLATDLKPNRLERAKREIKDLLLLLKGDRVGYLPFAGKSFIQLPLTDDYKMAELFLDNITEDLISSGGTNIAEALELATTSLTKSAAYNSEGKVVLLITDGEDHSGKLMAAAKEAKSKGIKVFVVGIGSPEGAPLLLPDGSYLKDSSGNVVVSKLAENDLAQVAELTGGIYVRSVAGDIDLERIYTNGIRSSGDKNAYGDARQKIWNEVFQWFIGGALFFLVLGFFISPYRLKKIALLVVLCFSGLSTFSGTSSAEAFLPQNKDFEMGVALAQENKLSEAGEYFSKASKSSDLDLAHASYFNLGNIHVKLNEFEKASDFYRKAYNLKGDHTATLENMKWVSDLLNKNKQDQQAEQGSDQQGDQQENQQQNQQGQQTAENQKSDDSGQKKPSDGQKNDSQDKNEEQTADNKPSDASDNEPSQGPQSSREKNKNMASQNNSSDSNSADSSSRDSSNENSGDDKKLTEEQIAELAAKEKKARENEAREKEARENSEENNKDKTQTASQNDPNASDKPNDPNGQSMGTKTTDDDQNKKEDEKIMAQKEPDPSKQSQQDGKKDDPSAVSGSDEVLGPNEIGRDQAVGLFRNLEENLEAYGRKPNFRKDDSNAKDW